MEQVASSWTKDCDWVADCWDWESIFKALREALRMLFRGALESKIGGGLTNLALGEVGVINVPGSGAPLLTG